MAGIVQPCQTASSRMQRASHTHPSNDTVNPTAGRHAAASPCQHGTQAKASPSPRAFPQSTVQLLLCVCVLEEQKRRGAQGGTSAQQEAQLDGGDTCGTAPTSTITHGGSTPTSTKKQKQNERKTRRQGVAVCVALRVAASPGRNKKAKQEGKKCVLRPTGPRRTPTRHGSLSAPFVAAPPHACSRRGAKDRRHKRVGGCASGAVGRETHGTPHRKSAAENN
ncbi:hypothetical protein ECC02_009619 [Trypanosoma cruzi]|uniref:Uncharacterized protein n=1 Tax=Trypanosoma cruzi TaxID=5693 RepID=A0A7J6XUJ3_TRYCR|nr:hypothetical protein ECC02_009619 [Trypanosoma cruzi]